MQTFRTKFGNICILKEDGIRNTLAVVVKTFYRYLLGDFPTIAESQTVNID